MRLMLMIFLLGGAALAAAQDAGEPFGAPKPAADPFGAPKPAADPFGAPKPAADPFGAPKPAADPFGTEPWAAPKVPAAPAPDAAPPRAGLPIRRDEPDPAVLAIREMAPTTATDLMFAVRTLFDMGRTEEAKFYLVRLLDLKPEPAVLVQFYNRYGASFFHRLRRHREMVPEGEQFARAVLDATHQAARDPERLRDLVRQFSSASPARRFHAIETMRRLGDAAVPPLLEALADPERAKEHAAIRSAIGELGEHLLEPMVGALETSDVQLRVQVLRVLGELRSRLAVTHLVGPSIDPDSTAEEREAASEAINRIIGQAPSPSQVEQFLYRRANDYLEGMLPGRLDYEDRVTLWTWDDQQKTSVPRSYDGQDASLLYAARLARDLYRFSPDNVDHRRLYLLTSLEWAKHEGGLDRPLRLEEGSSAAEAAALPLEALEDVLEHAMQTGRAVAATAAAEVLGERGDAELLQSLGGQPRPLARALRHADRRLRMAAAEAILRIDPRTSYAGSSFLTEALAYAVRTYGTRRALVVHPRVERSQSLIGMLLEIGFEADAATTGRGAFRLASTYPDYEIVLISDMLDQPSARETIQMFRRDPRTNRLAIGLMGGLETLRAAERFAESDPLVEAFPQPLDITGMSYQGGRLLRLAGRGLVGYDERLDQATSALEHLDRLASQPHVYGFYDLQRLLPALRDALSTPQLSVRAASVLGKLGAPDAQRALVALVGQQAMPLAARQAAARAFADAVQERGVLLTRPEILLQYERYNQSEHMDAGTQQVLGWILDAIEAPGQAAQTQADPPAPASAAS